MPLTRAALPLLLVLCAAQAGGTEPPVPVAPQPLPAARCVPDYTRPDFARLSAELQAARSRWAGSAARRSGYTYTFTRMAAPVLLPPVTVTVDRQGRVTRRPQTPNVRAGRLETLFDEVARSLEYARRQPCIELTVTYSRTWGVPTDFSVADATEGLADGNGSWTLRNFQPLSSTP